MHSASSRFNSISMTTGFTLAFMCLLNFFHNYFMYQPKPIIDFKILSIPNFMKTSNWQQIGFRYNLDADLSSLYTWNLKQLFVYIQVQWKDPKTNLTSRTMVSDWIISTPQNRELVKQKFKISVVDKSLQYSIRDIYNGLKGNELKLTINAEYMPYVGIFFKVKLYETSLKLPQEYTIKR